LFTLCFKARNLPEEWQKMFEGLNKTLQAMGQGGLRQDEANLVIFLKIFVFLGRNFLVYRIFNYCTYWFY
jgi:hypothetical protein